MSRDPTNATAHVWAASVEPLGHSAFDVVCGFERGLMEAHDADAIAAALYDWEGLGGWAMFPEGAAYVAGALVGRDFNDELPRWQLARALARFARDPDRPRSGDAA